MGTCTFLKLLSYFPKHRYYERLGLIPKPNSTENGYRMYAQQTILNSHLYF
ncbi:MerR family DNA-binding transcriptional regulator [Rossellomorea arthrocnemi]|uniref:MerR family DNA-binding transcriptional regulator n=1 Tax=Rossellomorea arthrocnemi TaxID=2769542 RepID=UPI0019196DC3